MYASLRLFVIASLLLVGCVGARTKVEPPPRSWTSWRGPNTSGIAPDGAYAIHFNGTDNLAWRAELPGPGCSTPIVWGTAIILTTPIGTKSEAQDAVVAFDWSGKERWRTVIGKARPGKHANGSGSNPSPIIEDETIFVYYRSGNLAALDLNGKLIWKTNLQERFGEDTLWWEIGTSPIVTKDHVVIAVMQDGDSYVAAFQRGDGELAWKVPRIYECPTEGDHSYTTPIVIEHKGREAILVFGAEHLTAHDAADGSIIWSCGGFNPEQKKNWLAIASPVVVGDIAVVPYGRGDWLAGVRLGGEGDVTQTHRIWNRHNVGSFVPTPATDGERVYLVRDKGEVVCVDAKSGETKWSGQLPKNSAKYYGSPVIADGKIYTTREDGTVLVAKISDSFETLAENHMGEKVIASPVAVDGHILLRGVKHLFCVASP